MRQARKNASQPASQPTSQSTTTTTTTKISSTSVPWARLVNGLRANSRACRAIEHEGSEKSENIPPAVRLEHLERLGLETSKLDFTRQKSRGRRRRAALIHAADSVHEPTKNVSVSSFDRSEILLCASPESTS